MKEILLLSHLRTFKCDIEVFFNLTRSSKLKFNLTHVLVLKILRKKIALIPKKILLLSRSLNILKIKYI